MIRLPKFLYVEPGSLEEVCLFLEGHGRESRLMAGGTDLLPAMKLGLSAPKWLVNTSALPGLDQVEFDEGSGLRIGASVKISALARDALVRQKYPSVAQAARCVGSPQLRQMGTVGGNLSIDTRCDYYNQPDFWRDCKPKCIKMGGETCNAIGGGRKCFAVFSGDLAPVLITLDARIRLVSAREERTIPLSELYTGNGANPCAIKPEEILVSVEAPAVAAGAFATYSKFAVRKAIDFPLAGVATLLTLEGKEKLCRAAKVVIGAVGPRPDEVKAIGQLLEGKKLSLQLIEEASSLAFKAAKPVTNRGSSPAYRKLMIKVLVRKALRQAL
jgi:4-hydroxybenzoyl-CoA reductase subunit beta